MDSRQAELLANIDLAELGPRVRAARLAAALTQGELAAGADVSVGYVSRIESGQRRPNARVLTALAARLDTPVEQLLSGVAPRELDQIRLTLDYAELSLESGEATDAETFAEEGRALAEAAGVAELTGRAGYLHARAMEALGRLDEAIVELEPLLDRLGGVQRAEAAIALCRCYRESGDLTKAVETGEQALEHLGAIGLAESDEAVRTAVTLAAALFERGDTGQAVRVCRTAVLKAEKLDSPAARAAAYWNASMIEFQQGAVSNAVPLAHRALTLLGEGQDTRNLARLRSDLGAMQLRLDPPQLVEAKQQLERAAEDLAWSSAGTVAAARNELSLARALLLDGDISAARELSSRVHDAVSERAPILAADAKTLEGQAWAAQGSIREASSAYQRAVYLLTGVGSDRAAGQLWFDLAELLEAVGDLEAARHAYRSAGAATGLRSRSTIMTKSAEAAASL